MSINFCGYCSIVYLMKGLGKKFDKIVISRVIFYKINMIIYMFKKNNVYKCLWNYNIF